MRRLPVLSSIVLLLAAGYVHTPAIRAMFRKAPAR